MNAIVGLAAVSGLCLFYVIAKLVYRRMQFNHAIAVYITGQPVKWYHKRIPTSYLIVGWFCWLLVTAGGVVWLRSMAQ